MRIFMHFFCISRIISDYPLMYLFCILASEPLEFWDKVLFIFAFVILSTMSQSLSQFSRILIYKIYINNIYINEYYISYILG